MEIVDLHSKLVEAHPHASIPSFPIDSATTPPPKRRSTFLNTLSRLASPSAKSGKQSSQARKSQTSNVAPPSSFVTPIVSPQHEPTDPFAAFSDGGQPSSDPSLSQPVTNNTSTAIAAYLTTISNDHVLRLSKHWKRFVRVRTDDLESARIERAIKRVRSDLAAHVSPKMVKDTDEPKIPEGDKDNRDIMGNHVVPHSDSGEAVVDPAAIALPGSPPKQDILPPLESLPDTTASAHEPAVPEPQVDDETSSVIKPEEEASVDGIPTATKEATTSTPAATGTSTLKIHRSQSADPDKATRLSRAYVTSAPSMDDGSQTESEASASISVPSRRRTRKKRSISVDPNGKEIKKKSQRKVVVDDFEMLRVLGKGCAGKVLLVKYKSTGSLYAMKAITKRHVLAHQELQHTLTEQAVLKKMAAESKDPFVVRLWWSFHDKENLFLIMDFHPGGDLATQLARWGRLGRDRARFYAAEIVEGVEGLHAAGVIYRDLKPENILIGSDGHIVLTDFGLSKEFPRRNTSAIAPATPSGTGSEFFSSTANGTTTQPGTPPWMKVDGNGEMALGWPGPPLGHVDNTSTFCGTAEYLAPEVIQGLPYSYEVDWWSFGTMLYEMLTGITPFWANNHSDMYVRVLQDELQFPDDRAVDPDTKSLIRGLLQRNPGLRICEPRIKKHPYFSMIDWSHVYYKRYIPPYIPPIDPANASDTQNFDDTFLEMEPVLDDPNDIPTDADQTDTDRTDGEDSGTTPSQSRSSSVHLETGDEEEQDVFDGYSYKGRHSVLIDDEEEASSEEYSTSEGDEEEVDLANLRTIGMVPPQVVGKTEEKEEEEVAVEPKTPEARPQTLPETVESPKEPEHPPKTPTVEVKEPVVEAIVPEQLAPPTPVQEPQPSPAKPRKSKDLPPPRFTEPAAEETPVTIPPKTAPRPVKPAKRREKSGVAALDKYLDEDTEAGERDDEDDDWDFIDAVDGEDRNGTKGTSLFARGVVDKYRLAVFRKASTPSSSRPNARTASGMSKSSELSTDPTGSPSSQRRGRTALSFRKTPRQFLQPKSPPSSKSSATAKSLKSSTSVTLSATSASSSMLTPSHSGAPSAASPSLKSKESAMSVSNDSFSSGNSGNNETTVEDQPRTPVLEDHDRQKNKKLKKVKDNMFSIFTSQR